MGLDRVGAPVYFPAEGPWTLPVNGFGVASLNFGLDLDLLLEGPSELVRIGLSSLAEVREPDDTTYRLDPTAGGWPKLAAVFALIGDTVTDAQASDEAGLRLKFASGRQITVALSDAVETWEVTAERYKLIGGPGGVQISDQWSEDHRTTVVG